MAELRDIEANNFIPEKCGIHDLVDTGGVQTLVNGVRTLYTNDAGTYEYRNATYPYFNNATGKLDGGPVEDQALDIKIGGIMNAASANTRIRVEVIIDATVEIPVDDIEIEINRTGVDVKGGAVFPVYNGAAAVADGFKIYLTAINGDINISGKHMLLREH